jgi:hypothetical protein
MRQQRKDGRERPPDRGRPEIQAEFEGPEIPEPMPTIRRGRRTGISLLDRFRIAARVGLAAGIVGVSIAVVRHALRDVGEPTQPTTPAVSVDPNAVDPNAAAGRTTPMDPDHVGRKIEEIITLVHARSSPGDPNRPPVTSVTVDPTTVVDPNASAPAAAVDPNAPAPAVAVAAPDVEGQWTSIQGRLTLTQDGTKVKGDYGKGTLEGELRQKPDGTWSLHYTYKELTSEGGGAMDVSPDLRKMGGPWKENEEKGHRKGEWNLTRIGAPKTRAPPPTSTPPGAAPAAPAPTSAPPSAAAAPRVTPRRPSLFPQPATTVTPPTTTPGVTGPLEPENLVQIDEPQSLCRITSKSGYRYLAIVVDDPADPNYSYVITPYFKVGDEVGDIVREKPPIPIPPDIVLGGRQRVPTDELDKVEVKDVTAFYPAETTPEQREQDRWVKRLQKLGRLKQRAEAETESANAYNDLKHMRRAGIIDRKTFIARRNALDVLIKHWGRRRTFY